MADTKQYDFIEQFKDDLNKIKKGIDPSRKILKPFQQDLLPIKYAFKLNRKGFDPDIQAEMIQDIGYRRSAQLRTNHLKNVKTAYEQFWKTNIQLKSSPPQWKKDTDPKKEYGILENELYAIFGETEKKMRGVWQETIKKIVKGKKHKGDVKLQAVKHATMPVMAVASGILAVLGTLLTLGLAIPLTAILFHKSAVALKGSYDFAIGRYRSTAKLEDSITTTVQKLEQDHNKYIKENDPAKKKKAQKDIADKEIWAAFFETFFARHKKSMDHLDKLLGKYEKKIREHYADLVHLAKKTGKHKNAVEKLKAKSLNFSQELIKSKQKLDTDERIELKDLDKLFNHTKKLRIEIKKHEDTIPVVLAATKSLVPIILHQERDVKKWKAQLKAFKSARPDSVKKWKTAFKSISIFEDLAAIGLGSAGGTTTNAIKQFQGVGSKLSENTDLVIRIGSDIKSQLETAFKEMKNQVSKHKSAA